MGSLEGDSTCLLWRNVKEAADRRGVRAHGHFGGAPGKSDAAAARRALLLLALQSEPDAVVLLRDADRDEDRLTGLPQARDAVQAQGRARGKQHQ